MYELNALQIRIVSGNTSSVDTAPPSFCATKVTMLEAKASAKNGIFSINRKTLLLLKRLVNKKPCANFNRPSGQ